MILGIGIDLLDSNRINKITNKYNNKLALKILSKEEIIIFNKLEADKKNNFIAKRFSAKESLLKALGLGLGRGIKLTDISIINNNYGKPEIKLNDKAKSIIENFYKFDIIKIKFDISITDEKNLVNTITIISN